MKGEVSPSLQPPLAFSATLSSPDFVAKTSEPRFVSVAQLLN